jgi:hypothetical protein
VSGQESATCTLPLLVFAEPPVRGRPNGSPDNAGGHLTWRRRGDHFGGPEVGEGEGQRDCALLVDSAIACPAEILRGVYLRADCAGSVGVFDRVQSLGGGELPDPIVCVDPESQRNGYVSGWR